MNKQYTWFLLFVSLLIAIASFTQGIYAQEGETQSGILATSTPIQPTEQPTNKVGTPQSDMTTATPTPTQSDTNETMPYTYELFEGDIQVPVGFTQQLSTPGRQSAWSLDAQLWLNGVVPYEFAANVTQDQRNAMLAAMNEWMSVANVHFIARNGEGDYIYIQNSTENSSQIGRKGGRQDVNIYNWDYTYIIEHELAHALGFWHEQSRPDRDQYIIVNAANIEVDQEHNFIIHNDAYQYGYYDFDSVMHYDQCAFSKPENNCPSNGGQTITVREPFMKDWQSRIGQHDHLSYMDKLTMSFVYPQPNWRFLDGSSSGGFGLGTFLRPYNLFSVAYGFTSANGTLWIQPGMYSTNQVLSKPMTLQAPLGGVVIGR